MSQKTDIIEARKITRAEMQRAKGAGIFDLGCPEGSIEAPDGTCKINTSPNGSRPWGGAGNRLRVV